MSVFEDYKHLLIDPNENGMKIAKEMLTNGELVAFPTETVYGLGANAFDEQAVLSIFSAKGRPLTDPLIVHVVDITAAKELVAINTTEELELFDILGKSFWPGPLTIITKASKLISLTVTAGTGYVGIRCPNHPIAQLLLKVSQLPIAAPSANRFGHVSPTKAIHVLADLGEKGIKVINGESSSVKDDMICCEFGIESTVIKIDNSLKQLQIFRQGGVSQTRIEKLLIENDLNNIWSIVVITKHVSMINSEHLDHSIEIIEGEIININHNSSNHNENNIVGQVAPGQAITHYSPDVPCFIVHDVNKVNILDKSYKSEDIILNSELYNCVIIDFHGILSKFSAMSLAYRDLSPDGNTSEAARLLFDTLRWSEKVCNASKILIVDVSLACNHVHNNEYKNINDIDNDISLGLADRIFRAASGRYLSLSLL
eukprot:gene9281-12504_t